MDASVIANLLARVKAATGPDQEIDRALTEHLGYPHTGRDAHGAIPFFAICAQFTASIDAALALVEKMLPGWTHGHQKFPAAEIFNSGGFQFYVAEDATSLNGGYASGEHATLPLAILAALLTALSIQGEGK